MANDGTLAGEAAPAGGSDILARWHVLIDEYEALREALRAHLQQPHWPGVGPYLTMLKTEAATVARLLALQAQMQADGVADEVVGAKLAASNLAAREVVWRTVRKCRGLLALDRRFSKAVAVGPKKTAGTVVKNGQGRSKGHGRSDDVFVNAVVDDGRTWVRLVTTTEAQLLLEMAESGWEFGEDGGEENDDENDDVDIRDISVGEAAADLVQAARANRYKGAYPRICLVLSRIEEGRSGDVDAFLRQLRRQVGSTEDVGEASPDVTVTICCANDPFCTAEPPALAASLAALMPQKADTLTPTLNIDTSILIALVSDITHSCVAREPWHPQQRVAEIERERQQPGQVLRSLCAAMRGRRLVCTREAARACRDMVQGMGQVTEQGRAAVLLQEADLEDGRAEEGEGDREGGQDRDQTDRGQADIDGAQGETTVSTAPRLATYRALSAYPDTIPDELQLPVTVVDEDWDLPRIHRAVDAGELPTAAAAVADEMVAAAAAAAASPSPTMAVFFYGWAAGQTTVTTNLAATNRIARLLEQFRTSPAEQGPTVWVCRTARSLNGTRPGEAVIGRAGQ